jgi:photosystem II stability/assembly factor-like uncharacterized protein
MTISRPTRVLAGAGHYVNSEGRRCSGGVFRMTVGDGTWQAVTAGLPEQVEARAFAVHPTERDVVYAGTQDGPYRSTNAGERWERLGFPARGAVIWTLAFHPTRPNVMYAGTAPVGIYRSEDFGETWTRLDGARSPEHCPMGFPTRTVRLLVDPSRPDDVYAALEVSGIIRSSDAGETWADLSQPLIELSHQPHLRNHLVTDNDSEGMLDSHALAISAAAPGTLFLAVRMGLFRSDDRGASWRDLEIGRHSPLTYCRDVAVCPHDPKVMYACLSHEARGTVGSLYRSDDIGESWTRFDHGVQPTATMMAVSAHPRESGRVYCASRGGQVFGTEDGGASWLEYPLSDGVQDVYSVACL